MYVLYVEHKFIEPAFGKVVAFPTFLMENSKSFLKYSSSWIPQHRSLHLCCTCGWM